MIAALLLTAVLGQAAAGSEADVIFPGLVDLPLVEGSTRMADCGPYESLFVGIDLPRQCLMTTMAQSDAVADAYVDAAKAHGWLGGAGVANVVHLHQPQGEGRCRRLDLAVFPAGQATGPTDPAIIILGFTPSDVCPTEAPAR